MRADARSVTLNAFGLLAIVRADARSAALEALAPLAIVRADARSAALESLDPLAIVRAHAASTAGRAPSQPAPMLTLFMPACSFLLAHLLATLRRLGACDALTFWGRRRKRDNIEVIRHHRDTIEVIRNHWDNIEVIRNHWDKIEVIRNHWGNFEIIPCLDRNVNLCPTVLSRDGSFPDLFVCCAPFGSFGLVVLDEQRLEICVVQQSPVESLSRSDSSQWFDVVDLDVAPSH